MATQTICDRCGVVLKGVTVRRLLFSKAPKVSVFITFSWPREGDEDAVDLCPACFSTLVGQLPAVMQAPLESWSNAQR